MVAIYGSIKLADIARDKQDEGISHVMPGEVNILLMGGDRYLTANILNFRSLVSVGTGAVHFSDQAQLQVQAAVINPYYEDNYYQAAASLPWEGHVEEAQLILGLARKARFLDPWPSFFEAFNEFHFNQNGFRAAELSLISAERSEENNKALFKDLAAKWMSSTSNHKLALGMVFELEKNSKSAATKYRLRQRITRLEIMIFLEEAIARFEGVPKDLDDLVEAKIIDAVPKDPFGRKYSLSAGRVVISEER
jgi:hypothetical protein